MTEKVSGARGVELIEDAARNRFVMAFPEGEAFAVYRRQGDHLVISHTEVPPAARGHGLASRLVKQIFDHARSEGSRVVPACSFVADWAQRHPDYADVVAGRSDTAR